MSNMKRAVARGRASLLASSMFATTALAGLGGMVGAVALTPGAAFAQTCTPVPTQGPSTAPAAIGPATQFCTGNYTLGIGYDETTAGGNLTVNLDGPGLVQNGGVVLNDVGGSAANLTLVLGNATNVGQNIVTNTASNAVTITSTGGNVVITTGNNTIPGEIITGNIAGISATTSGNGAINVSTIANVTGLGGPGIVAQSVSGNIAITVGGAVVGNGVSDIGSGVRGRSEDASVSITLGNVTTVAGNTTSVTPFSVTGNVTDAVLAIGGDAFFAGNASAVVNVTDPGNVNLTSGTKAAAIVAVTFSKGVGSSAVVNMTGASGGTISAEDAGGGIAGVSALSELGGSSSITTNAGLTVIVGSKGGNGDAGLFAQSSDPTFTQSATVTLGASNTITVGNATSVGSVGIEATNVGPAGSAFGGDGFFFVGAPGNLAAATVIAGNGTSVTVNGNATLVGVEALNIGNATVTLGATVANTTGITVNGNVAGTDSVGVLSHSIGGVASINTGTTPVKVTGGTGVEGIGGAGVLVTVAGNVNSNDGVAILTSSGGNTGININGGTTSGLGQVVANVSIPTVQFTNNTANTTTLVAIGAAGTLQSNPVGNATTASPSGLIIAPGPGNITIGSIAVTDAGHMIGTVDFSRVIGTGFAGNATLPPNISNTTVAVTGNGVWLTSGTSKFGNGALGAGNATVASDSVITGGPGGNGLINTVGTTTFQFGTTTANSFTNIGTTRVGSDGAPSTLNLTGGPILLTNAGVIDLSTGAVGTDALTGLTTAFVGVAGGQIATKAQLGGIGSIASVLTVATTSGANNIKVTDAGGIAGFVPVSSGGIVLVRTGGTTTNGAAFVLDPNSTGFATFGPNARGLIKGMWLYTLANTGQNEVLVSSAGPGAFEAPIIATAAQDIWYATAPWQDRQADLRDSALLTPGDLGSFTPGVWI
jgi:hypothetical protein